MVAEQNAGEGGTGSFIQYQEAFKKRVDFQRKIDYCQAVISTGNQLLTHLALNVPHIDNNNPVVLRCRKSVEEYYQQTLELV